MKAPLFSKISYDTIKALQVLPPLESKDKSIAWARGSIRDADFNELLVTGPRLPVLYSGCRYNNVVFSIRGPGSDNPSFDFESFLHRVLLHVEDAVAAKPDKFKPGIKNAALLHFDKDFIRPSSYSVEMPNELRVKLIMNRSQVDEHGEVVDVIGTEFVDEQGDRIDPTDISAGSEIVPIIRISYYRNMNKFGLNLTMLRGLVFPSSKKRKSMDVSELEFDL